MPIPLVNADGSLAHDALDGDPAYPTIRHAGGQYLYGQLTTQMLDGSAPFPPRVLLGHSARTRGDKRRSATAEALLYALLAFLPALLVINLLTWLTRSTAIAAFGALAVICGAAVHGYDKASRQRGDVREITEWLDLEERTWREKTSFFDDDLPTVDATLMLRSLALVCTEQSGETESTYDVSLCRAQALQAAKESGTAQPARLGRVFSSSSQEEANRFARTLASRWRIGCREHRDGPAAGAGPAVDG